MPNGIFQESSGTAGGMVYDLPFDHVKQLGPIFSLMDTQKSGAKSSNSAIESLRKLVSDVGVSQTTLEEVFMAVTNEN